MQNQENPLKKIYADYIQDIFILGEFDKLERYVDPDWTLKSAKAGMKSGKEVIPDLVNMFRAGFSDFTISLDQLVVEKDWLTCRSTFTGTHSGPFMGLKARGNKISMTSFTMIRFRHHKIRESWVFNDMEALKNQLS